MLIIDQMIKADEEEVGVFFKAEALIMSLVCPKRGSRINILNHGGKHFSVSHTD